MAIAEAPAFVLIESRGSVTGLGRIPLARPR